MIQPHFLLHLINLEQYFNHYFGTICHLIVNIVLTIVYLLNPAVGRVFSDVTDSVGSLNI